MPWAYIYCTRVLFELRVDSLRSSSESSRYGASPSRFGHRVGMRAHVKSVCARHVVALMTNHKCLLHEISFSLHSLVVLKIANHGRRLHPHTDNAVTSVRNKYKDVVRLDGKSAYSTSIVQASIDTRDKKSIFEFVAQTFMLMPNSSAMIVAAFSPIIRTVLFVLTPTFPGQMLPSNAIHSEKRSQWQSRSSTDVRP